MSRTALLDVNVLLALFDPEHVHHDIAHDWFAESCTGRWASCPVTENGFLRTANVAAQKSEFVPTAGLIDHLRRFQAAGRHEFWNDDVSVLDEARFEARCFARRLPMKILPFPRQRLPETRLDYEMQYRTIHGYRRAFVHVGKGPALLRQRRAVEQDRPGVDRLEAVDAAAEGGLSGARGPDQDHDLARSDREVDVHEGLDVSEGLPDPLQDNQLPFVFRRIRRMRRRHG